MGHARDYIEMQWLILQQETPQDYVIATGRQYTVRDFVDVACQILEINIEWQGNGIEEYAKDIDSGNTIVKIDPRYFRPSEVETLLGDASKAKKELGWEPKITFIELVNEMVLSDLETVQNEKYLIEKNTMK